MSATQPYDLQRLYAEEAGEPFQFTWADQVWTLPNMRMLDITTQERMENLDTADTNVELINSLFDDLLGVEQGARWREVVRPLPMILQLFSAWVDHSKAAMGESPASDGSSKSTGRPSKRTSSSSSASGSRAPSTPRARKSVTPPVS